MTELISVVEEHPFFEGLSAGHLEQIASHANVVHFHMEDVVFREGDSADTFYLLLEGAIALELFVPGRRVVTIQTLHKHDLLGWSWLYEPYRWHFHARAIEPTKTLAFDSADNMYVNSGTPVNNCESKRMSRAAPGLDPCPYLERSGG